MVSKHFPTDSPSVQVEIVAGQGVALSAAARRLPSTRAGRPVAASTLWRWSCQGVKAPDGRRVHLEVARCGCRWLTSEPALARFLQALNGQADAPAEAPPSKQSARRAAEVAGAQAELRANGM